MKKNLKKIILVTVMLVSLLGITLTVLYAKNNLGNNINGMPEMNEESMESPPDMPNGNEQNNNVQGEQPQEMPNDSGTMKIQYEMDNQTTLTTQYIIMIIGLSALFSGCLIYLIMSRKNDKFYKVKDKLIICILATIVLTEFMVIGTSFVSNNYLLNNKGKNTIESSQKDEVTLDESHIASSTEINLSEEKTDVTINKAGKYTFTGTFDHSIIIDAGNEDVEIVLDNVTIENSETATIIGLNANKITIHLNDGTVNTLTDGGNSEYDGCIFSNAELEFVGSGQLIVNGNQNEGEGIATEAQNITFNGGTYMITSNDDGINAGGDGATITFNDGEFYIDASGDGIDSNKNSIINGGTIFVMGSDVGGDAGIDTDDGFVINGGTVIALGSDMIETPLESSQQKSLCFSLNSRIEKETIVTLMNDDNEIISFQASKSFKTIIISSQDLVDGNYELYVNGSNTGNLVNGIYQNSHYTKGDQLTINGETSFEITKIINVYKGE